MRAIEWNVGLRRGDYTEKIVNELKKEDPGIVILTEVKVEAVESYKSEFEWEGYQVFVTTHRPAEQYNDIVIAVRDDPDVKVTGYKIRDLPAEAPDLNRVRVESGDQTIDLLAVRFMNTNITKEMAKQQYHAFLEYLREYREINVLMGDFNQNSALTYAKEGLSWSRLKKDLKDLGFRYFDATGEEATFSYQRFAKHRHESIGTSPDNIFLKTASGIRPECVRYHWADETCGVLADHAMLIADLK